MAATVLIAQGRLPVPDYVVIADTGREAQSTWDYLEDIARPLLAEVGVEVHIAPHSLSTVDLYAHNGALLIPAYTTLNGSGKLPTFCSTEWKRRVMRRWLRGQGVDECEMWICYTISEVERIKPADVQWVTHSYPLVDLMLSQSDCESIILEAGLPLPHKSACWMCPHRNNEEWRVLRDEYPADWRRAVDLENEIQQGDPHAWLHGDCVPLEVADLSVDNVKQHTQCGLGMCWI